jgi:hypothetical protein
MENLDCKEILNHIQKQIIDTIDQYPLLSFIGIKTSLNGNKICFQVGNIIYEEKALDLTTAYVNDIKVDYKSAISLNTDMILAKLDYLVIHTESR